MKLERVHHVQIMIPADKESEAKEFYSGFLGLKEIPKPKELAGRGGFWMELHGFQIHFGFGTDEKAANSREHVAFLVDSLEDWAKRLESRDIKVKDGITIEGFRRFEFRDPFDNRIEFLESI